MTGEADSSVVLAELQVVLFRECNNQRNNTPNLVFKHVKYANCKVFGIGAIMLNGCNICDTNIILEMFLSFLVTS